MSKPLVRHRGFELSVRLRVLVSVRHRAFVCLSRWCAVEVFELSVHLRASVHKGLSVHLRDYYVISAPFLCVATCTFIYASVRL